MMSDVMLQGRIIIRNDTRSALEASTIVLYKGEIAIEIQGDGTAKFKVGNGTAMYRQLPYSTLTPDEIRDVINDYVSNISISNGGIITVTKGDGTLNNLQIPIATNSSNGLLSSADKIKYDTYDKKILSDTTDNWELYPNTISEINTIYIYTDYQINDDLTYVPGIKIGDGESTIVELPFIDDYINSRITNILLNAITEEERQFWNNKVRCYMDENVSETLIFTTE